MPSKSRWALNPRKWFGTISNAARKREQKSPMSKGITPFPSTSAAPHLSKGRNKTKVVPVSSINDNNYSNSTTPVLSFTQFHLPAFVARREKTSILISTTSTLMNRTKTFVPTRLEPSIRRNGQYEERLSIDATRWNTQAMVCDTSKLFLSPSMSLQYENFVQENSIQKQSEINLSNLSAQCLVDYPQISSNNFNEKCPSPAPTQSSSSTDDNDDQDGSSSSGVFTDERTDLLDQHRTASKDTLSTLEILSMDSIVDSQISLNHCQSRPIAHHYRLPMPTFETIDVKPVKMQCKTPMNRFQRAYSAEGILKDHQTTSLILTKTRQSSAAIAKKIEKRISASRSPTATLGKAGFVRVANDKYRLTTDKDHHLYRQRRHSVVQYSNFDDSLLPANDEESYATLPRTSSTEQLNNENLQNDLREMIDDYLRPVVMTSINKAPSRSTKTRQRSKRSQMNHESAQITIDDLTDKLLSSIDPSIYAQYQRCY